MSFNECDEALDGGMFFGLDEDGATAKVVLVGEPIPIPTIAFGSKRNQNIFPIVGDGGLQVWGVGATIYKQLRDGWAAYSKNAILITRKGAKNDKNTKYPIKSCPMPVKLKGLVDDLAVDDVANLLENVREFAEKRLA